MSGCTQFRRHRVKVFDASVSGAMRAFHFTRLLGRSRTTLPGESFAPPLSREAVASAPSTSERRRLTWHHSSVTDFIEVPSTWEAKIWVGQLAA